MPGDQWEAMAPRWERARDLLWQATRPVSEWLVARLDPQPGQTLLDLAAGSGDTGFLAAERLGPDGVLITSDREPGMVEAAERRARELGISNARFRVLDAERIDLPAASIDRVVNRFGYILRGDPPPALGEIRRVLRPDGRLAFAVWGERRRNAWMTVPADVMVERGHLAPQGMEELRLSERRTPAGIEASLRQTGFTLLELEELEVSYRFGDADELWFFVSELRGPVALALARLDEPERLAVRAEIERRAAHVAGGYELGGISLNVVST